MRVRRTSEAPGDLACPHQHLSSVAHTAAARVVQQLVDAPERLLDHPWIGEKLEAYEPREVRRITLGDHEVRYEIAAEVIFVLRIWHCREDRSFDSKS